jgi:hypothetical protein
MEKFMAINFNINMISALLNSINYVIELSGNSNSNKTFNVLNNESLEIGFDKNKIYNINAKNLERTFSLFKINNELIQGANSYVDENKLTIDFTENIPQRSIELYTPDNETLYITYRLDNVNNQKLKAFTLDLFNYETGVLTTLRDLPQVYYLPYTGDKYNTPCYPFIEFGQIDPCTDMFVCSICNSAKGIFIEQGPGATMIVPRSLLPFNIYGRESIYNSGQPYVDYDFDYRVPGSYRIFLNNNLFKSCCCEPDPEARCRPSTTPSDISSYCDKIDNYELSYFKRIKKTDLIFDQEEISIADYLENKFNILFLDNISFSKIKESYFLNYSGQINNTKSFIEGDSIAIRQYYYPYEECFSKIFYRDPEYSEVDQRLIYSIEKSGENYFSNQNELIQKINLIYNSSGIYSWIPLAFKDEPVYDFGPLLLAEAIDDNNISIKSLKSGLLGKHLIKFESGPERKGIASTWMLPKNIKLQGSNNLIDWVNIVDTSTDKSLNEIIENIPFAGKIPYDNEKAAKDTKITKTVGIK